MEKSKITQDLKSDNKYSNKIMLADERYFGNKLTIKETLIWLEETKIFFYNIKKSIENEK